MVAISDDPAAGGSSSSPGPTPAPTPEVVDVEAGTKGVPVVFPARLSTTRARGTCTSCRAAAAAAAAAAATAAAVAIRHRRRLSSRTWMPEPRLFAAAVGFASFDAKTKQLYIKPV